MEPYVITDDYYLSSPYDSLHSPYDSYWLAFIDEKPLYLWDHLCTYVFINSINGNFTSISHSSPPEGYSMDFDSLSVSKEISIPSPDYTVPYSGLQVEENDHYYAVLFSGYGQNAEAPFWNHLSHMYCALKEKGFAEENIYVLSGDGTEGSGWWANTNMNLDNTGGDDIMNVPCTVNNLDSIFQLLETKLTEDDLLFIFATTHGGRDISDTGSSNLKLYQEEELWDTTFARILSGINCSQMIIPLYACYSGGLVDELMVQTHNEKRTVFAPVPWQYAYVRDLRFINVFGMDVFPYFLITAFRGSHPFSKNIPWNTDYKIGTHPGDTLIPFFDSTDFHPDYMVNYGNGDSTIQIGEAIYYTKQFDSQLPISGVINYDCGFEEDLLGLTGISGNINNTQTVTGNFIVGGDLILNDSATLTIADNCKFYIVNGDMTTNENSELILGDDLLIKNFQEKGLFLIEGDFVAGTGINFESFDSTNMKVGFNKSGINVELSECNFENVSLYGYTDTLTVNSSSIFTNSRIKGANHLIVDSTTFTTSSISMKAPGLSISSATITNSSFNLPHPDENSLVSLYRFATYHITGDTFANWNSSYAEGQHSVAIECSGTIGSSAMNNIKDNVFLSSENGYSNTNGILVYASIANILNNDIQNQNVGVMLTGSSQSILSGTPNFCNEETQVIINNNICQVYASEYSFPTEFIWNVIYHDTLTKCFVHHDIDPNFHHDSLIVVYNFWSDQHDPDSNLIPMGHYAYRPIYEPCSKSTIALTDANVLYQTGIDQIATGNYAIAKITFQEVVNLYPKTEQASNALKDIFNLESLTNNDFASLKTYYLSEDSIVGNERLERLGQNLANKCDEKLGNYEVAIDWYEDMIEYPPTLQDSVFAIIDLENCYSQMEIDSNLKSSSYVGKMAQYKLSTEKAHQDHRNELLALLLKQQRFHGSSDDECENIKSLKSAELLQNTPNPFNGITKISYHLLHESDVKFSIHNYNGQLIKTILVGMKPEGTHTTVFDASGLQSGIYFYSISINGYPTDSKKMTIIN